MAVYLDLFHGRIDPKEELDDWGFNGPVIGPLPFVHITYGFNVKIEEEYDLNIHNDGLLFFEGCYYGDFSIFSDETITNDDTRAEPTLRKRIEESQKILKGTDKDWPLLLDNKEHWIKAFVARRLQGKKLGGTE